MIITNDAAHKLYSLELYLRPGVDISGQGFIGVRSEFRATVSDNSVCYFAGMTNCNFGSYSTSNPANFYNASIGNYCSIADGTKIVAHHAMERISTSNCTVEVPVSSEIFANFKGKRQYFNSYHTLIGHDVWIGGNVLIKDGLIIGHGAVIGANSTVTHNVPPFAIVAGNPAKIIRMRFSDEDIERILNSNWYAYDWNNIEVDWGDLHNCLSMMEDHLAAKDVPLIGPGYFYQSQANNKSLQFKQATWTFERQIKAIFKASTIQDLFALPNVKSNLVH